MGADLSRVRFNPRRDHAGVILQQGRLLLDSDWNELVAIMERKLRASVADLDSNGPVDGIAGVAVVPRTTPHGFEVTLTGGAVTIGRGRMYVDGLLAENHGLDPAVFEPLLSEQQGSVDTPYGQQPYWKTPQPLPTSGKHLAYLDIWQREVTHLESPDLVDIAIGVDTTARMQTVWQVRLHELRQTAVVCSTKDADIQGWAELIAPSGGRISVDTIPVTDTQDPCELPPTGGYRGLENQTYRVEVHTAGKPGQASFKWSRDNGTVVTGIVEVLPGGTSVRPASFGKDSVLRFKDGDWVEILDDHREFNRLAGVMRKIAVHEEHGTITFTPALPADLQLSATDAAARHLRLRRWDQRGQIKSSTGGDLENLDSPSSTGVITVPSGGSTKVVLEHGIVVQLSAVSGEFRVGDHWIFAARTADTSVEKLLDAPPLGIHHHYARLAVVDFPDAEQSCRVLWPPECSCDEGGCSDCTVCVTPESHASGAMTIQDAVIRVKEAGGGVVCVASGTYHLASGGVVIDHMSSVTVRGQGLRTVVVARERGFVVSASAFITLQDFTIIGSGQDACVRLEATVRATVQRLTMLVLGERDEPRGAIELGGVMLLARLRDNEVIAQVGISGGAEDKAALLTAALHITGNVLLCRDLGISLDGRVGHLSGNSVVGNTVLRASQAGIRMLGTIAPGQGCDVDDNTVTAGGSGIEVATSGFTVDDNDVTGTAQSLDARGDGVMVRAGSFGSSRGPTRLSRNRVRDVGGRGIVVLAPVRTLELTHNLVERALDGIVMDERARTDSAIVSGNTVTDVGSRESDGGKGTSGIQVVGVRRATVESNIVHGVAAAREAQGESVGVRVLGCLESRVAGNSVDRVGFPERGGLDIGIAVQGMLIRSQVSGNASRRQPVDVDLDSRGGWRGMVVGAGAEGESGEFVNGYVLSTGSASFAIGAKVAFAVVSSPASVTVDNNIVGGGGELPAVLIGVFGDVVATGNQVHQQQETDAPALLVTANVATVSANRLRGGRPSGELRVDPERIAVLGNLSSGGIFVGGGQLQPPWLPLNIEGV